MNRWCVLIGTLAIVTVSCGGDSSSGEPVETAAETAAEASDPPPDSAPPATESSTSAAPATEPNPTEPQPEVTDDVADDEADETEEEASATEVEEETSEAERPDPCSVWTVADLRAATGLEFNEGVYNDSLSVNGQDICDWIAAGDILANAQVLVLAPGLDHDFLRGGTDTAFGPVTDLDIVGADAAHISVDGFILGIDVDGIVLQLAYLPPSGVTGTGDQLIQLADAAVASLAGA